MKHYPTPHINATPEDFAKTVLMPGDPLRSEFVAKNFLTDAKLVNNVRSIKGYTGKYKGIPVSVMASGMGMPSIGIYSYELYNFFGVDNIIRIGSAGGMSDSVKLRDIIIAMGASTDSNFAAQYNLPGTLAPLADYTLLKRAIDSAEAIGAKYHVGNILSTDRFYSDDNGVTDAWRKMGVLAVEMEAAALYMNAARAGKRALAICTVSDHLITVESLPSEERQVSFTEMMEIALETAINMEKTNA
ncbi:MAG: purine-nucleoside phosphorylase [Clostridia bacterium]|nr:purine-nucleoside phosphorylase [Clostridia bacterium]